MVEIKKKYHITKILVLRFKILKPHGFKDTDL